MGLLVFGVVLFAALHAIPAVPPVKTAIKARVGRYYGAGFSFGAVLSLGLIVAGWRTAPFVEIYQPIQGGRYLTFVLVLLAFVCLGIFLFRGRLRQILRMPLAVGVVLWGSGHLFANGDLAGIILFGGFIAYGLSHLVLALANGVRPQGNVRTGHDLMSVLGGIALFGLMTQLHETLIGVGIVVLR